MTVREKATTTMSTKGQVILPKYIRDRRHWNAGTRLIVEDTEQGVLLKTAPLFPATAHEDVAGMLRRNGPPISLEEMDAAVTAEAKKHARD